MYQTVTYLSTRWQKSTFTNITVQIMHTHIYICTNNSKQLGHSMGIVKVKYHNKTESRFSKLVELNKNKHKGAKTYPWFLK